MRRKKWLLGVMIAMLAFSSPVLAQQNQTNVNTDVANDVTVVTPGSTGGSTTAFPIPGMGYAAPTTPGYWGVITPDGNYLALKEIIPFMDVWSMADAESFLQQDGKTERKPVFRRTYAGSSTLTVVLHKPQDAQQLAWFLERYELIGTNTAKGKDATTFKVLGGVIKDGLKGGADLVFCNEGAGLELKAGGWGFGFNNSISMVSGGKDPFGNVAAAGIGITRAWARYATNPFLQAFYFKKRPGAVGNWNPPVFMPTAEQSQLGNSGNGGGPEEMTDASKLKPKYNTLEDGKKPRKKNPTITTGR